MSQCAKQFELIENLLGEFLDGLSLLISYGKVCLYTNYFVTAIAYQMACG